MSSAIAYLFLGGLFTYLALHYATETVWNPLTISLLVIATIDIGIGITHLRTALSRKKNENK